MSGKTRTIVKTLSICAGRHTAAGVTVTIDDCAPLLCGMAIDGKT